jgi:hypothetical protein
VAHLHNCGLRYLERTDPAARVPAERDRAALAGGRRIVGSSQDAASYLGHDHHHRGQIVLLARLLGYPVSRDTMAGMSQWAARARE